MEIGLTPREIQTRVRAGASLAEVAEAAGVPSERIEPFAAPVLAEREHIATLALAAAVRRRGEAAAHRTLNVAVTDRLGRRGIPDDEVSWDAWRREDRRWTLVARYELGAVPREAVFYYNQQSRISEPANDDARWLAGELSALPGAPDDPTEPTVDLNDELALVRALREPLNEDPAEVPDSEPEPPIRLHHGWRDAAEDEVVEPDPSTTPEAAPHVPLPRSQATPQDIGQEIEAQLSNYSGGGDAVGLDLLYDLLDKPSTDRGYDGLTEPEQPPLDFGDDTAPAPESTPAPAPKRRRRKGRDRRPEPTAGTAPADAASGNRDPGDRDPGDLVPGADEPTVEVPTESGAEQIPPVDPTSVDPVASDQVASDRVPVESAPSEPAPVESTSGTPPRPAKSERATTPNADPGPERDEETVQIPRPRKRRKRASVPTWDEIMFGGDSED